MKKIGIMTLNGYFNYGNRLQNYALEQVIREIGVEVETVWNTTNINKAIKKSKKEIFLETTFQKKIEILKNKITKKHRENLMEIRDQRFEIFSKIYLNESRIQISNKNIPDDFEKKYSAFIAGSDQVWNFNDRMVSEINFMTFTSNEKRLTYAPSFGVSEIPAEYKNEYTKWLNGIDNISVREDAGAKIVKDLTGKDALVVVDPTMLLTKEEWLKISKVHENKPKEKYLLTYFLGEIPKEIKQKIKSISKSNKLQVVNLAQIKDKKYYLADPSEFIDYINDAEVFVTDSFHGCVFSLLMDTPLIVCDRVGQTSATSMSSRIETFVNKFYIQDRQFKNIKEEEIFKTNYKKAYEILEVERKKSFDYLESILKVKVTQ